jgi:hypothetical protein
MAEVTVEPGALRELHVGVSVLIASKSLSWHSRVVAPDTRRVALCPVIDNPSGIRKFRAEPKHSGKEMHA